MEQKNYVFSRDFRRFLMKLLSLLRKTGVVKISFIRDGPYGLPKIVLMVPLLDQSARWLAVEMSFVIGRVRRDLLGVHYFLAIAYHTRSLANIELDDSTASDEVVREFELNRCTVKDIQTGEVREELVVPSDYEQVTIAMTDSRWWNISSWLSAVAFKSVALGKNYEKIARALDLFAKFIERETMPVRYG